MYVYNLCQETFIKTSYVKKQYIQRERESATSCGCRDSRPCTTRLEGLTQLHA